jgi:hypothetical protein
LAGCTEYWEKPGGSTAEFEAMKGSCTARAYSQFPPMLQQIVLVAGYRTPIQTICTGYGAFVNCYTTGGEYVPPSTMTVDRNENVRDQAVRSCFFENGWTPVKKDR